MAPTSFFVTGATGAQGGATARELLSAGHKVHAIVRDPNSAAALDLKQLGAAIFEGSFDDVAAMELAAQGCSAAFINASPVFTDTKGERTHVANIVSACRAAGVQKALYTSTVGVGEFISGENKPDPESYILTYLESKAACESAVQTAGFANWTVVRIPRLLNTYIAPTAKFMFPGLAARGVILTGIRPDIRQTLVDPIDVGKIAKEILVGEYPSRAINFASQESLTMAEIVDEMNRALQKQAITLEQYDNEEFEKLKATNPLVNSEDFINRTVKPNTTTTLREYNHKESSAREFFRREIDKLKEAVEE